jgi:hypothetical protein
MDGSQRTSIGVMTKANTTFMPNWDVPGWDYFSVPNINNSLDCQRACDQDVKCRAWTFVSTRELNNNCFLKTGIPRLETDPTCTSGVKQSETSGQQFIWVYINRTLSQQNPKASSGPLAGTIWLDSESSNDQWFLGLNIFIDHSVIEVFEPQGGRVAITTRVYPEEDTAENLAVYVNIGPTTNQNITIDTFDIWTLNGIWT